MTHKAIDEAIAKVRTLLESELGYPEVEVDASAIPERFRMVSGLAAQFGVGDDGIRGEAINLMPEDFVFACAGLVSALEPHLSDWIDGGEWTD